MESIFPEDLSASAESDFGGEETETQAFYGRREALLQILAEYGSTLNYRGAEYSSDNPDEAFCLRVLASIFQEDVRDFLQENPEFKK